MSTNLFRSLLLAAVATLAAGASELRGRCLLRGALRRAVPGVQLGQNGREERRLRPGEPRD